MNEIVKRQAMLALPSMTELGTLLAKSGYFQDARDMAQAVVKVLAGQELGFGPIASMTGVNIIKGKVALSANLMAAAIKRSGRYNYRVLSMTDKECSIRFFEAGEPIGDSTFTMDDAKKAGLAGANWNNFPRNMLFARALSNGAKWYCPDLSGGPMYTPDELGVATNEDGEVTEHVPTPVTVEVEAVHPQPPTPPLPPSVDDWRAGFSSAITLDELAKMWEQEQKVHGKYDTAEQMALIVAKDQRKVELQKAKAHLESS